MLYPGNIIQSYLRVGSWRCRFLRRMVIKPTHLCHKRRYARIGICNRAFVRCVEPVAFVRIEFLSPQCDTKNCKFSPIFFLCFFSIIHRDKQKTCLLLNIKTTREKTIFLLLQYLLFYSRVGSVHYAVYREKQSEWREIEWKVA